MSTVVLLTNYYLHTSYPQLFTNLRSQIRGVFPTPQPSSTPLPTRSPYPLIPDKGTAGTFNISQSHKVGPIFTTAIIDPLSANSGDKVNLTLTIKSDQTIKSLTGNVLTDKNPIKIKLSFNSRTDNTETWTGIYNLTAPVLYNYVLQFDASDGTTEIHYELPLRTDP